MTVCYLSDPLQALVLAEEPLRRVLGWSYDLRGYFLPFLLHLSCSYINVQWVLTGGQPLFYVFMHIISLNIENNQCSGYCYSQFTDETVEAQRGQQSAQGHLVEQGCIQGV